MAKYITSIGGFDIGSDSYIDKRLILTKEQMLQAYDEWFMPERYIAYCLDDKQWYEYNEANELDPETGYYRPIPSGIVKDVKIDGESILDENGVADFVFPVEDVLVNGVSTIVNKKAQIDLSGLQDKLVPGENIEISESNVISAKSVRPLEGNGIKVDSEGHVSIDSSVVPSLDTLPADVESITDNLGLIDKFVMNLENYYLKDETYNRDEILGLIDAVSGGITLEVVAVLPVTGSSNVIYLVRRSIDSNVYDQYVWFNNAWVQVGSTEVDLSQYYSKEDVDDLLEDKQDKLTAGNGISIVNNVISSNIAELPDATASTKGVIKYDNVTLKKNDDGQLYAVGGEGTTYYEGDNIYFTTQSGKTYINTKGYEAGDGINISNNNKVSAKVDDQTVHINRYGEIYMDAVAIDAGDGITIRDGVLSVDRTTVPTESELALKQDKLVAGENIVISGNVISSTGGGSGSANWGQIGGTLSSQRDLQNALDAKAEVTDIPVRVSQLQNDMNYATVSQLSDIDLEKQDKLIAGANITISPDNVISATGSSGPTEVNWGGIRGDIANQSDLISYIDSHVPSVSNASVIIKKNGSSVGGFTLNQSASGEVNITVPTFSLSGTVLTITNN